jgi:hypothetical protein
MTRAEIATSVSTWLKWAGLRLSTTWDADEGVFRHVLGPDIERCPGAPCGYLFGVLAMQLAAAVSSPHGTHRCDNAECRALYTPDGRKPNPKRDNYCPSCRLSGDAARAARRRSYHKNKSRWAREGKLRRPGSE